MDIELRVALAQIAPVWLDKKKTLAKIEAYIDQAAQEKAELIVFGESLLPGYPYWIAYTDGARFDEKMQKAIHAHYLANSITIEHNDLETICTLAREHQIAIYLGCIERPLDRGGHSAYASLVFINTKGVIKSVHRKLQPTYEERLSWSPGDGHGLQVHSHKAFMLGGLNCWENWMPLPRAALYAQGENVHVAVWPGSDYNTKDITRFIARESRSYAISVSSLMRKSDISMDVPYYDILQEKFPEISGNGGSCIAQPNGEWLIEPVLHQEGLLYETLAYQMILEERQNFDPVGHYSRPDVTKLLLNTERQSTLQVNKG